MDEILMNKHIENRFVWYHEAALHSEKFVTIRVHISPCLHAKKFVTGVRNFGFNQQICKFHIIKSSLVIHELSMYAFTRLRRSRFSKVSSNVCFGYTVVGACKTVQILAAINTGGGTAPQALATVPTLITRVVCVA
jgi:hypothetical protein